MVRILFAGALTLALQLIGTVAISHAQACATPDHVKAWVAETDATGELDYLGGEEAAKFLAVYNALPPQSAYVADAIMVIGSPSLPTSLIFAFENGCLKGRTVLDRAIARRILTAVRGTGA